MYSNYRKIKDAAGNEIKHLKKPNPEAGLLVVSELDQKQIRERRRDEKLLQQENEMKEMKEKINGIETKLDLILMNLSYTKQN